MYNTYMKTLIKYCLELSIINLKTFTGYKGGDILSIETDDKKVAGLIKNYCHRLEIDSNIKYDSRNNIYTIFCHFGKDIYAMEDSDDCYELKEE